MTYRGRPPPGPAGPPRGGLLRRGAAGSGGAAGGGLPRPFVTGEGGRRAGRTSAEGVGGGGHATSPPAALRRADPRPRRTAGGSERDLGFALYLCAQGAEPFSLFSPPERCKERTTSAVRALHLEAVPAALGAVRGGEAVRGEAAAPPELRTASRSAALLPAAGAVTRSRRNSVQG